MSGLSPHVSHLRVADPDGLMGAIRGGDLEARVLGGHRAETLLSRVTLPGSCLDQATVGPSMWFRGVMPSDCYTIVYVKTCHGEGYSFNFNARHRDRCLAFYTPGEAMEAIVPAGYQHATLTIPKSVFQRVVENHDSGFREDLLAGSRAIFPDERACESLSALLSATTKIMRREPESLANEAARVALQNDLHEHFLALILNDQGTRPTSGNPRLHGRFQRLRRVREFVREHAHRRILLRELCAVSGLSRRGLEYLFQDLLGISVSAFLLQSRLHGVRRELLAALPCHGLVKQSALNWGFWHLGRFAREYHDLFGEKPSETLARRGR
jgi:AraC family ethanolamine operon transcriptional activator